MKKINDIINYFRNITPKNILEHIIIGNYTVLTTSLLTKDIVIIIAVLAFIAIGKELIWDKLLGFGTPQVSAGVTTFFAGLITLFLIGINF